MNAIPNFSQRSFYLPSMVINTETLNLAFYVSFSGIHNLSCNFFLSFIKKHMSHYGTQAALEAMA